MKTAWLIFKKDTKRYWPLLLVWLVQLTLHTTVTTAGFPSLAFGGELLTIGRWIVFIVLAISIVQADRLVGNVEFWMTRPVSPTALVGAKVAGLTIWLILPATLADVLAMRWLGATPGQLLDAGFETAIWTASLGFGAAALSAVTATTAQWTVATISLFVTMSVVPSWPFLQQIGGVLYQPYLTHSKLADFLATSAATSVLSLVVLVYQAVARRRGRTIVVALIGFALVWNAVAVWPDQNLSESPAVDKTLASQLQIQPIMPPKSAPASNRYGVRASPFVVPLKISGATGGQLFFVARVESRLTTNSGTKKWDSGVDAIGSDPNSAGGMPYDGTPEAMLSLPEVYRAIGWNDLGESSPINSTLWGHEGPPLLEGTPLPPQGSGKLESKLFLREYSVNLNELPLQEGAKVRIPGGFLRIAKIVHAPESEGLVVNMESYSFLPRTPFRIFLLNRSRYALIDGSETGTGARGAILPIHAIRWYFKGVRFDSRNSGEPNFTGKQLVWPDPKGYGPTAEWLSGATLVILSLQPGGQVEKTIVIDPFPVGESVTPPPLNPQQIVEKQRLLGMLKDKALRAKMAALVSERFAGVYPPSLKASGDGKVRKYPTAISMTNPSYPVEMRRQGIQSIVWLSAIIGQDGNVERVDVLSSQGPEFSDAARSALLKWRFTPASIDGKPVRIGMCIPFAFTLGGKG